MGGQQRRGGRGGRVSRAPTRAAGPDSLGRRVEPRGRETVGGRVAARERALSHARRRRRSDLCARARAAQLVLRAIRTRHVHRDRVRARAVRALRAREHLGVVWESREVAAESCGLRSAVHERLVEPVRGRAFVAARVLARAARARVLAHVSGRARGRARETEGFLARVARRARRLARQLLDRRGRTVARFAADARLRADRGRRDRARRLPLSRVVELLRRYDRDSPPRDDALARGRLQGAARGARGRGARHARPVALSRLGAQ